MSDISWGVFTFVLGVSVVFLGMFFLVLVLSIIGAVMKSFGKEKAVEDEKPVMVEPKVEEKVEEVSEASEVEDGNLRAAIIAAVMMCLEETRQSNGSTCEFVVRRIKRI